MGEDEEESQKNEEKGSECSLYIAIASAGKCLIRAFNIAEVANPSRREQSASCGGCTTRMRCEHYFVMPLP